MLFRWSGGHYFLFPDGEGGVCVDCRRKYMWYDGTRKRTYTEMGSAVLADMRKVNDEGVLEETVDAL